MSEKIAMTPSGAVWWEHHHTEGGDLYVPAGYDDSVLTSLAIVPATPDAKLLGVGSRDDETSARAYKLRGEPKVLRVIKNSGSKQAVGQADLDWLCANLTAQEALLVCKRPLPEILRGGVRTPDYLGALSTQNEFRVLMSNEAVGRTHPDPSGREGDLGVRALDYVEGALAEVNVELGGSDGWGSWNAVIADDHRSNMLVGDNDAVVLDLFFNPHYIPEIMARLSSLAATRRQG